MFFIINGKITTVLNIGIKHDFLCINICFAMRVVLKHKPERRQFQQPLGAQQMLYEPVHENSNNVVYVTSKASDQPSDQSLCLSLEYSMSVKLLTEHHLRFIA